MISRLKKKFIIINMFLVSIVLIITFIGVYVFTYNKLSNASNSILKRVIEEKGYSENKNKKIGGEKIKNHQKSGWNKSVFLVQLDNENNIINIIDKNIEIVEEEKLNEIVLDCIKNKNDYGIIINEDLRYLKHKTDDGLDISFIDRDEEIDTLNLLIKTSILVGTLSLVAFFIISIFLSSWAIKPAEEAFNRQKQFIADASHELKTPLTTILANAEILLSHKNETISNEIKWIQYIKLESERMKALVDDLLFLAKLDYKENRVSFKEINLSDLIWSVILPFESLVFENNKKLESNIDSGIYFIGNENQIKQLVVILIDNAIKYCNEKGKIKIELNRSQNKINLCVNNSGLPIQKEEQEYIFERFYRVDKSRVRENGGYGLGLSIAKEIVELHKGQICVISDEEYGTTFKVTFNQAQSKNNKRV